MTAEKVIEIILANVKYNGEISANSHLQDDLHIGSFDRLMIVNAIEDEFGIHIDELDLVTLETVQDIADKLTSKYNL